ncbi:MAG: FUN14 domain-containing protein [Planctomycetota bacterium]
MSDSNETEVEEKRGGLGGFKRVVLFAILGVLVLSVAARAMLGDPQPMSGAGEPSAGPAAASSFVGGLPTGNPGTTEGAIDAAESGSIEEMLPFVTEGSFFALIGFALGYATRKVVKLLLIFVAIFFAGLQALVYAGVADVDWGQAVDLVNNLILNVKEGQTITEIAKAKLPSAGGLGAGYLLGWRRG